MNFVLLNEIVSQKAWNARAAVHDYLHVILSVSYKVIIIGIVKYQSAIITFVGILNLYLTRSPKTNDITVFKGILQHCSKENRE